MIFAITKLSDEWTKLGLNGLTIKRERQRLGLRKNSWCSELQRTLTWEKAVSLSPYSYQNTIGVFPYILNLLFKICGEGSG